MKIKLTVVALVASTLVALGAMYRAAGGLDLGTLAFGLWAISPYAVYGLIVYLLRKRLRLIPVFGLVGSLLMLAFTGYVYLAAMDGSSSTEALAFVIVPIYLYAGGLVALAIGAIASKLSATA